MTAKRGKSGSGVPSPAVRFALEAGFLVLVALGAGLAELPPLAIVAVMAVAWIMVAVVERASAKEAARNALASSEQEHAEPLAAPPASESPPAPEQPREAEPTAEAEREPEAPPLAVDERTARAILASGPPPGAELPQWQVARRPEIRVEREPVPASEPERTTVAEPQPEAAAEPEGEPEAVPEPEPALVQEPEPVGEPEPAPVVDREPVIAGPPQTWNVWDLDRRVRDHVTDDRYEEWTALLMHLREFASADGSLPLEFDPLVRDTFGHVLLDPEAVAR